MWFYIYLFILSPILQVWYVEVWISRIMSESPLDFEITSVDCMLISNIKPFICPDIFIQSFHVTSQVSRIQCLLKWYYIEFIQLLLILQIADVITNSVDPDQTLCSAALIPSLSC